MVAVMIFISVSKARLFMAPSQHLNGNGKSVNNSEEHSFSILSLLQPLSGDLLTERQVGVRVQVTGASIVAISVTELTARGYSTICAAGGVKKNIDSSIALLQAPKTDFDVDVNSLHN